MINTYREIRELCREYEITRRDLLKVLLFMIPAVPLLYTVIISLWFLLFTFSQIIFSWRA